MLITINEGIVLLIANEYIKSYCEKRDLKNLASG